MENIKKVIIILIIVIIILIISILLILRKSELSNENKIQDEEFIEEVFDIENKIQKITTKSEYFNVKMCIDKYEMFSNELFYAIKDNDTEYIEIIKNQLPSIIPDFVFQKLNLSYSNIYDKIGLSDKYIRIDNIYVTRQTISKEEYIENTDIRAYIVDGSFIDWETFEKEDFKMIIVIDTINSTFFIIPQEYIEQEDLNLEENSQLMIYDKDVIQENEYNSFEYSVETEEDMCKEYLNRFRFNLTYDLAYTYKCLDKEYRNVRFGDYSNYEEYIQNNIGELNKIKLEQYMTNYYEDHIEYVCKDQFENLYIFEETSPMNFTLKLDTYTITTDKFKDTYKIASDAEKVHMNIDKFIQMMNRQDYQTSYNYISEGFKNNYFSNQSEFEQFLKERFFLYNEIKINKLEQQGDLYICNIEISDLTKETEEIRNISIIMKLNEETDFEMSFVIE